MAYVHDKHEEVVSDRTTVPTVDWATYPNLTFPEVPTLEFELIQWLNQPPLGQGRRRRNGRAPAHRPFRTDRVEAALAGS